MEPELFLLEMAESEECHKIMYKRLAIHKYIGLYYPAFIRVLAKKSSHTPKCMTATYLR